MENKILRFAGRGPRKIDRAALGLTPRIGPMPGDGDRDDGGADLLRTTSEDPLPPEDPCRQLACIDLRDGRPEIGSWPMNRSRLAARVAILPGKSGRNTGAKRSPAKGCGASFRISSHARIPFPNRGRNLRVP